MRSILRALGWIYLYAVMVLPLGVLASWCLAHTFGRIFVAAVGGSPPTDQARTSLLFAASVVLGGVDLVGLVLANRSRWRHAVWVTVCVGLLINLGLAVGVIRSLDP